MMITIKVVSFNGHPPLEALSAEFDELGGSIGRGEGNTLVLPDPERHISRTHASIAFRGGRYVIQDRGTATPVKVNGLPLGQGSEAPIGEGDKLIIGGYTLQVAAQSGTDSHLTNFGRPMAGPASGPVKDDPLGLFGAGGSSQDPFADLTPSAASSKPSRSSSPNLIEDPFAAPSSKGVHGGSIPTDFDPFSGSSQPSTSNSGYSKLPDDFDLGLGPSSTNQNIDELFGLGPGINSDPFAPGGPLAEQPIDLGGSPASPDLLAGLGGGRPAQQAPSQRNDTPELQGYFRPPVAKPDPAMAKPASPPETRGPDITEPEMVLSWDEKHTGEIKTMIVSPRRKEHEDGAPVVNGAGTPLTEGLFALSGTSAVAPDPRSLNRPETSAVMPPKIAKPLVAPTPEPTQKSPSKPAAPDELLRAFLDGAGVPGLQIPGGLSPETMHMLGTVLREAMQGTLDLLLARATIKREVRAEVTMIVARENNPLKFSPNAEAALTHLLAPQTRGFMPPIKAMKDAYNDLRSHQFGFMAGMRAALAGVLQRFNPEQLERRISEKSMLDSLLPMNRKARLWNLFEDLYGDISREAEEDFHALFGKEFVRAYEAQIDKLEREQPL